METVFCLENVRKKFKDFELNIPKLEIPKGFATALIGENGAGKSTMMNILAGTRLDYKGKVTYFEGGMKEVQIREAIGYTSATSYFMPHWTIKDVGEVSELLFDGFHKEEYKLLCADLNIEKENKSISNRFAVHSSRGVGAFAARNSQSARS